MTAVVEDEVTAVVEGEENTAGETEGTEDGDDEDSKSRDFTKFTKKHEDIAAFINANEDYLKAGLEPLTAGQVKAAFALRTDFNKTPEALAAAAERKAKREAEKAKYAGLTPEEIKKEKAAARAEEQANKLQARVQAALAKAQAIREGKDASGEDVAAAVEAEQGETPAEAPKKRIGRSTK